MLHHSAAYPAGQRPGPIYPASRLVVLVSVYEATFAVRKD